MERAHRAVKLVTEGPKPPVGEVYQAVGAAAASSVYVVKRRQRQPAQAARALQLLPTRRPHPMIQGQMLADVIPTFDMINMIGGECDR